MEIVFDKVLEFNEELYRENVSEHSFNEPQEKDGIGEDNE